MIVYRKSTIFLGGSLLAILLTIFVFQYHAPIYSTTANYGSKLWPSNTDNASSIAEIPTKQVSNAIKGPESDALRPLTLSLTDEQLSASLENAKIEHIRLFSNMTDDGEYFPIKFDAIRSFNPTVIPHPYKDETYIAVAQRDQSSEDHTLWRTALVCEAKLVDSKLLCVEPPMNLPIAATLSENCSPRFQYLNDVLGPRDARIFYGPSSPYILYGSQSGYICLGMWLQDLRRVVDWGEQSREALDPPHQPFLFPIEIRRPVDASEIEKNYFLFWDLDGKMYVHFDFHSDKRAFAAVKSQADATIGEDLAPLATSDAACLAKYMPVLKQTGLEWMHQATNSLSITMCSRSDSDCSQTSDNTFIFTILQHKTYYNHGVYEPYVVLFSATAPFAVHAISSKPFWIPGRGKPYGYWMSEAAAKADPMKDKSWVPQHQSQMLFIVSMAWRKQGQMYHGFLDDELLIAFGVEDQDSAGIIVTARDLLAELNFCNAASER